MQTTIMTRMINTFGEHGPSFGSDVERFRFASQTSSLCPVYLFTYLFVSDCRWRRLCVDLLKRHDIEDDDVDVNNVSVPTSQFHT